MLQASNENASWAPYRVGVDGWIDEQIHGYLTHSPVIIKTEGN